MEIKEGTPVETILASRWQASGIQIGDTVLVAVSCTHPRHGELNFLMAPAQFKIIAEAFMQFATAIAGGDSVPLTKLH